ncbi:MAG: 3-oxoacyl-[acyl-carrier-protein] synthase III C-terminal domain-containing protein, partial [Candidatus Limnocylindrus sp.]
PLRPLAAIGSHRAAAFDLSAACSGFAYAYAVAHGFLTAGLGQRALVIGAESLSRIVDWSDRSTCVLFGDGAGAIVLDALDLHDDQNISTRPGTLSFELSADPSGAFALWIPGGTGDGADPLIKMDGAKTYVYATRTMAAVATAAIERAGLTVPQVDLVIPHQANLRIIEHVSKAIDYPMEKIFVNLDRYGNTSAASIPIALSEAVAAGRLKPGDVFCTVAFGDDGGVSVELKHGTSSVGAVAVSVARRRALRLAAPSAPREPRPPSLPPRGVEP